MVRADADRDKDAANPHRARLADKRAQAAGKHVAVAHRVLAQAANRRAAQDVAQLPLRRSIVPADAVVNERHS